MARRQSTNIFWAVLVVAAGAVAMSGPVELPHQLAAERAAAMATTLPAVPAGTQPVDILAEPSGTPNGWAGTGSPKFRWLSGLGGTSIWCMLALLLVSQLLACLDVPCSHGRHLRAVALRAPPLLPVS